MDLFEDTENLFDTPKPELPFPSPDIPLDGDSQYWKPGTFCIISWVAFTPFFVIVTDIEKASCIFCGVACKFFYAIARVFDFSVELWVAFCSFDG